DLAALARLERELEHYLAVPALLRDIDLLEREHSSAEHERRVRRGLEHDAPKPAGARERFTQVVRDGEGRRGAPPTIVIVVHAIRAHPVDHLLALVGGVRLERFDREHQARVARRPSHGLEHGELVVVDLGDRAAARREREGAREHAPPSAHGSSRSRGGREKRRREGFRRSSLPSSLKLWLASLRLYTVVRSSSSEPWIRARTSLEACPRFSTVSFTFSSTSAARTRASSVRATVSRSGARVSRSVSASSSLARPRWRSAPSARRSMLFRRSCSRSSAVAARRDIRLFAIAK